MDGYHHHHHLAVSVLDHPLQLSSSIAIPTHPVSLFQRVLALLCHLAVAALLVRITVRVRVRARVEVRERFGVRVRVG